MPWAVWEQPADILVSTWADKDTAVFDIMVASPLVSLNWGVCAGVAAKAAEWRKQYSGVQYILLLSYARSYLNK